ncbi:MAG: VRR-NUC domain-containing protein [Muribaculaceae bacterium]|nr:VRR-NUC domain-containing protein [Muribaculaceae bacterium]
MTQDEILQIERTYSESKIQHTCVCWFRQTFPNVADLLFAVPNGGRRDGRTGAMMKYEGAVSGVADLILLHPCGGKATLCIEMKVPKRKGSSAGKQSEQQREWQRLVEAHGSVYEVCHGIIEFVTAVCLYLHIDPGRHIERVLDTYAIYR